MNEETTNGGWKDVLLGEVCRVQGGFAFKSQDYVNDPDAVPLIRIGDLQDGQVYTGSAKVPVSFLKDETLHKYLLREGDVLIAMTGATTGKLARYRKSGFAHAFLNQRVGRIVPRNENVIPDFIFFAGQTTHFQNQIVENILAAAQGNISPSKLESLRLPLPDIREQRKIATVLDLVQQAIEQQERLIALTTELKKALLHKLFTEGIRGEPQKQTEIGTVPESWKVREIGELVVDTEQVNLRDEGCRHIKYIDVSGISRDFLRVESTASYVLQDAPERARKKVREGDVIFATVRPTLLRVVRIPGDLNDGVCSSAFCVLRDKNERTFGRYLYYVVQRKRFLKQLAAIESGANYPAVTDRQLKAQLVPVPCEDEQLEIARALEACDNKVRVCADRKRLLIDLFRTLLHQLMTAQIRVHDIDLTEEDIRIAGE